VYLFRDAGGRVVYVGRSRNLAARVRSYWSDLRDRPHLRRMVARVAWVEPVICESEHEAAFLESDLLERHPTRYNRTLGMESRVWLRLSGDTRAPRLDVVHDPTPADGASWFGPYLGWEPARQAAAGLLRLYPLRFTGSALSRSDRELAHSLGVGEHDRERLARAVRDVLARGRTAVRSAIGRLERMRDDTARGLMFEHAAALREQARGLRWITEPQKLGLMEAVDGDFAGAARGARVVLSLRGGRLAQRHFLPVADPGPSGVWAEGAWPELARANAELMARLWAADAVGPLGWRGAR
jgi:excinuclease ABC subunit C